MMMFLQFIYYTHFTWKPWPLTHSNSFRPPEAKSSQLLLFCHLESSFRQTLTQPEIEFRNSAKPLLRKSLWSCLLLLDPTFHSRREASQTRPDPRTLQVLLVFIWSCIVNSCTLNLSMGVSHRSIYLRPIWSCLNRIVLLMIYYICNASTPLEVMVSLFDKCEKLLSKPSTPMTWLMINSSIIYHFKNWKPLLDDRRRRDTFYWYIKGTVNRVHERYDGLYTTKNFNI